MSQTNPIRFHSIEAESQTGGLRPFVRFPFVREAAVGHLSRAIDFEANAGRAVRLGQLAEAEHLRGQARASWRRYREASGQTDISALR
jgi:hypothetical protein